MNLSVSLVLLHAYWDKRSGRRIFGRKRLERARFLSLVGSGGLCLHGVGWNKFEEVRKKQDATERETGKDKCVWSNCSSCTFLFQGPSPLFNIAHCALCSCVVGQPVCNIGD